MHSTLAIALPLVVTYVLFWLWWGGNGKPLSQEEKDDLLRQLTPANPTEHDLENISDVRQLLATDDGQEFVMQNLVQYRSKALYPPGLNYGDDPREADKRYGRAIFRPLLSNGNLILFVARRSGNFIVPQGADAWHYVAMVRYRSRRDFLKFAIASNKDDIFVHKWAAIQKTHVFPVKPIVSLITVRLTVALLLLAAGALLRGAMA